MKYTPTSVTAGSGTATSPGRMSSSAMKPMLGGYGRLRQGLGKALQHPGLAVIGRVIVPWTGEAAEIGDITREQTLLPRPFRARLLVGDFDPVAVGIAEVDAEREAVIDDGADRDIVVL